MNFCVELYHHIKVGGSIKSNTFADVFKEWKNSRRNAYQKVETKDRSVEYVATYALDYFGKTGIDQLTAKDFHAYWDWRKINFKRKKPTDDTLHREPNAIQSLMKFALHRGMSPSLSRSLNWKPKESIGILHLPLLNGRRSQLA